MSLDKGWLRTLWGPRSDATELGSILSAHPAPMAGGFFFFRSLLGKWSQSRFPGKGPWKVLDPPKAIQERVEISPAAFFTSHPGSQVPLHECGDVDAVTVSMSQLRKVSHRDPKGDAPGGTAGTLQQASACPCPASPWGRVPVAVHASSGAVIPLIGGTAATRGPEASA